MDVHTASLLTCPNDSGRLIQSEKGYRCDLCGHEFVITDNILDLLPIDTSQAHLRENYNAIFSQRPDRAWMRPLRTLIANLGNAYLYSWAARRSEQIAGARSLTILDAACGDGMLRPWVSKRHRYVGVDFSARPLLRAARIYSDTYVRGDLTRLPFADGSFDLAVSLQALQYLEHPNKAIREIGRVLKPDGHFLLSVPNIGSIKYRLQDVPSIQLQMFDRNNLLAWLSQYFDVTEIVTRGLWVPVPKIGVHLGGTYSSSIGLSWTTINKLRNP